MTIDLSRRNLLAGAAALGLAGTATAAVAWPWQKPFKKVGVQLYSVRVALQADPLGTLQKVRAIGFDEVETAGLAGKTAKEFRGLLDQVGLKAPSSHIGYDDWVNRPEAALDDVAALGGEYAVLAWLAPDLRNGWVARARQLNGFAALAMARGLKFAYHNHNFEFIKSDEGLPYHLLLENTDPELVAFELDCYWASFMSHDPVEILHEHGARIRMLHLKDKAKDGQIATVGQGVIDFAKVLKAGKAAGVAHVFVEHDNAADPFASITQSLKYLRG